MPKKKYGTYSLTDLSPDGVFLPIAECTWWRATPHTEGNPGEWWTTRLEIAPDETVQHLFARIVDICEGWSQDTPITIRMVSRYGFAGDIAEQEPDRPADDYDDLISSDVEAFKFGDET